MPPCGFVPGLKVAVTSADILMLQGGPVFRKVSLVCCLFLLAGLAVACEQSTEESSNEFISEEYWQTEAAEFFSLFEFAVAESQICEPVDRFGYLSETLKHVRAVDVEGLAEVLADDSVSNVVKVRRIREENADLEDWIRFMEDSGCFER